jgi:hypothetical protein
MMVAGIGFAATSPRPFAFPRLVRFGLPDCNSPHSARPSLSRAASELAKLSLIHDLFNFSLLLTGCQRSLKSSAKPPFPIFGLLRQFSSASSASWAQPMLRIGVVIARFIRRLPWVAEFCFGRWVFRFRSSCFSLLSGIESVRRKCDATVHGSFLRGGCPNRSRRFRSLLGGHFRRRAGRGGGQSDPVGLGSGARIRLFVALGERRCDGNDL